MPTPWIPVGVNRSGTTVELTVAPGTTVQVNGVAAVAVADVMFESARESRSRASSKVAMSEAQLAMGRAGAAPPWPRLREQGVRAELLDTG